MRSVIGITPTTQRVTGYPYGDCVRASYATILEVPIESVPRFDPGLTHALGQDQGDRERAWLATLGFNLVELSCDPYDTLSEEILAGIPEVPHLMSGISPRGFGHRVVGIGGQVVWDPHPSRAGLLTVYSVGLIVPLEED